MQIGWTVVAFVASMTLIIVGLLLLIYLRLERGIWVQKGESERRTAWEAIVGARLNWIVGQLHASERNARVELRRLRQGESRRVRGPRDVGVMGRLGVVLEEHRV